MTAPKVSVGLPVYNGENYLAEAIESVLRQSFTDFELVISDNASTDGTFEIIRHYADRDPRIRFERQEENRGAAWNYNRTFWLARAPYFKWMAHDDMMDAVFLEKAVAALDGSPEFVGAIPLLTAKIDGDGDLIETITHDMDPPGLSASGRFRHYLRIPDFHCSPFFGLFRRSDLESSGLLGSYQGGDRVFIGEMLLRGRFAQLPGVHNFFRHHAEQYSRKVQGRPDLAQEWLSRQKKHQPFRMANFCFHYAQAIRRSRLGPLDRFLAYGGVAGFGWRGRRAMVKEALRALIIGIFGHAGLSKIKDVRDSVKK